MKLMIFVKSILLVALLFVIIMTFNRCTTYEIPQEVCTYGIMTCDAGQFVCENFEIPEPICLYFNLACENLNVLCSAEYGSDEYKTALQNLNIANLELNKYIEIQQAAGAVK